MYDIVIPLGPCDIDFFKTNIKVTLSNLKNYNRVFIISHDSSINSENCITIDETIFPFKKNDVSKITGSKRSGWYLQQLIKLYCASVLNLENFLIVDADTVILKSIDFFEENKVCFNTGTEYHIPYFQHMKYILPELERQLNVSGICHLMPMKRIIVDDLFNKIESLHACKVWEVMLRYIDPTHYSASGMSEYELLFNFSVKYHSNIIKIRPLNWKNLNSIEYITNNLDYASIHWYLR